MKHVVLLLTLILSLNGSHLYESGWRNLEVQPGTSSRPSEYLDFNPLDTRIQMRLTQLMPYDNMEFGLQYEFFEEGKRTSYVSSVNFQWNTQIGHKSNAFLHIGEDFSECLEENPEMLTIPYSLSIDLNTDHTVELNRGAAKGTFKNGCERAEDGSDSWNSWLRGIEKIRKVNVRIIDDKLVAKGIKLDDYFELEYRLVKACPVGSSLSERNGMCDVCKEDHFSEGGYASKCLQCPYGSRVPQGVGYSEINCTFWHPCPGGFYKDQHNRCIKCSPGHYSEGGEVLFCTPCPENSFSGDGARHCQACPEGTGVPPGEGQSEEHCVKLEDGLTGQNRDVHRSSKGGEKAAGAMEVCRSGTLVSFLFITTFCLLQ